MIPVCIPLLGERELEYVTDCIKTNWISSKGKYVEEFEDKFAKYCGCEYGITTTSGTTALHLALASIGVGKGDEVIMPVHIYGHPCDMDPIMKVASEHDLYVVEDAAEAHGAEYKGKKTGGIGHVGCFSFYANKIITTGEGGMVVTNDEEIAERAKSLRNLYFPKEKRIYLHSEVGYNYRMTNIQAAIGLAQFERIDVLAEMRRRNAHLYNKYLKDIEGIRLPVEREWAKNVYWMYSILIEDGFGMSRDELMERLMEKGVDTRTFFIPMNKQIVFANMGLFKGEKYPVAEELSRKGMYLPSSSGLKEEEIRYISNVIKEM